MAHHIPEHKIIIVQTVIFIGLLVLLSFILEGCTSKHATTDAYVESTCAIVALDAVEPTGDCDVRRDCTASGQVLLAETVSTVISEEYPWQKGIPEL